MWLRWRGVGQNPLVQLAPRVAVTEVLLPPARFHSATRPLTLALRRLWTASPPLQPHGP